MTVSIITEQELDKKFSEYVKKHYDEFSDLIDTKIERAIKSTINNAFQTGRGYENDKGWAYAYVEKLVGAKAKKIIDGNEITVDPEEIREKVNKVVTAKLKKLKVDIEI